MQDALKIDHCGDYGAVVVVRSGGGYDPGRSQGIKKTPAYKFETVAQVSRKNIYTTSIIPRCAVSEIEHCQHCVV